MKIIFLESFYGGSHKSFLDGLMKHSRHDIEPITLPARFWKWRLRSAALYFAEQLADEIHHYDLLLATDMMNLAEFIALTGFQKPKILFFHENQLTYPRPKNASLEPHLGIINVVSALASDANLFNSRFQISRFLQELPEFINQIPEFVPQLAPEVIRKKSRVLYMGCDFSRFGSVEPVENEVPVILWSHRWGFDKQPQIFFEALYRLQDEGLPFEVIVLGENHQVHPREFLQARERLGDRIIQFGYVEGVDDYARFLAKSDIIISTAMQENFGFSIAEAVYSHTLPLLPNDLSYPELLPRKFHKDFLYHNREDLYRKLRRLVANHRKYDAERAELSEAFRRFDWRERSKAFDAVFEEVAGQRR